MDAAQDPTRRLIAAVPARAWWLGTFLCALAVRLAWLWVWQSRGFTDRFGYDPYFTIANFWHGWGPPWLDVTHPPAFPFWIYLLLGVLGRPSLLAVQLANVLLSSASPLLLGLWTRRAFGETPARLAGLWAAFDPLLVFFAVQPQSEPFFVFVELCFFLALQAALASPSALGALGTGLLGGLASLTRSVFGPFAPFLAAALLWPRRREPRAWALAGLLALGWAAGPSLWGMRNLRIHGRFIPLAVNGGWNLWEGFTLDREEVRRRPYAMTEEAVAAGLDPRDAAATGEYFARKTKTFMREHPGAAARIVAGKFFLYWRPWPYDPHDPRVRAVLAAYFSVLFLLAALGAWAVRRSAAAAPVFALFVTLSLLHSVFFTSLRYRTPLEPFLVVFAAAGALRLLGRRPEDA
ncbi:MAG: glycosyltransferase family 39 protein [Elusimicrobiota bacterium]